MGAVDPCIDEDAGLGLDNGLSVLDERADNRRNHEVAGRAVFGAGEGKSLEGLRGGFE